MKSLAAAGVAVGGASAAFAGRPKKKAAVAPSHGQDHEAATSKKPKSGFPDLYPGWNALNFGQIQSDENAHVTFLLSALGSNARPEPSFINLEQPDVVSFAKNAFVFENTGVAAYLGAAPYVNNPAYLAAAASIATIEGRHAGYLGVLFDYTMVLNRQPFDAPAPIATIVGNASPFVAGLNGGPPLTFDMSKSDANDIAILNFALALEYLERDYYNINVPKFFGT